MKALYFTVVYCYLHAQTVACMYHSPIYIDFLASFPGPLPSFLPLTVWKNRGRPGIIYDMGDVRVEKRVEKTY